MATRYRREIGNRLTAALEETGEQMFEYATEVMEDVRYWIAFEGRTTYRSNPQARYPIVGAERDIRDWGNLVQSGESELLGDNLYEIRWTGEGDTGFTPPWEVHDKRPWVDVTIEELDPFDLFVEVYKNHGRF
jgi:hypothetical protein